MTSEPADPIARGLALVEEIRKPRELMLRGAHAIENEKKAAQAIEDLVAFHQGYASGSAAEYQRALQVVGALVNSIALLYAREPTRPLPDSINHMQWISGTSPRLREAYARGVALLNRVLSDGAH